MSRDNKGNLTSAGPAPDNTEHLSPSSNSTDPSLQQSRTEEERDDNEASSDARMISPDMQLFIGRQLRAVYDDVAKQPVPDRFLELMKQLDSKTTRA
jgi:hypothetical protein